MSKELSVTLQTSMQQNIRLDQTMSFKPNAELKSIPQKKVKGKIIAKYDFLVSPVDKSIESSILDSSVKDRLFKALYKELSKMEYGVYRSDLTPLAMRYIEQFINTLQHDVLEKALNYPCTVSILRQVNPETQSSASVLTRKERGKLFDGADTVALTKNKKSRFKEFCKTHYIGEYKGKGCIQTRPIKANSLFHEKLFEKFNENGLIKNTVFKKDRLDLLSNWIDAMIKEELLPQPLEAIFDKPSYRIVSIEMHKQMKAKKGKPKRHSVQLPEKWDEIPIT